ncbi:MAG: 30S ribosomal protein S12 methylthiotransferase RimO [Eubacteriales bacterium]|nr:30S ribosomal protein S12 methylthiotransferase RimO [Eubacteriales bacterium]
MRIFIDTLGCPKNTVDSEVAAGVMEKEGHQIVVSPQNAEAILINTCAFINDAKIESIDRIFELASYKEHGAILIVSGCLSQRYGEKLYREMPEVDIFLGVNDYHKLPELLKNHSKGNREAYFSSCEKSYTELDVRKSLGPSYTAYLKIAEGCNNICAYCVIPSIRGNYRSRRKEDILKEAGQLARSGTKELVLVAQDVTAYGMDQNDDYRLPELLEDLCKIEGINWIRLMYCYEDRITDRLIEVMAKQDKICKYIDIPIQHASDKILASMNRRSTKTSIIKTVNALRKAIPDIHIRTTLITGFPGETTEDFNELVEFVKEMKFHRLGVFSYSKEEGTVAARMKGQVREQTRVKRREKVMAIQQEISLAYNQDKIGKVLRVIIEEEEEAGCYRGRSCYDAPEIDNSVLFNSDKPLKPGDLIFVKITDAFDYDLIGVYLD